MYRNNLRVGLRKGRLVIKQLHQKSKHLGVGVTAHCDCGASIHMSTYRWQKRNPESCGCYIKGVPRGIKKHPLYSRWHGIMSRCYNPYATDYASYGGRGIKVCLRWHKSANFIADMEPTFVKGLLLDRINNDRGYTLSNCRWVDNITQQNNKRRTQFITLRGVTKRIKVWSKQFGVNVNTVRARLRKGMSIHDALSFATRDRKRHATRDN